MAKGGGGQNLPADVTQLIDQLERHCLAPDGSLVSKSVYNDLQLVRSILLSLFVAISLDFGLFYSVVDSPFRRERKCREKDYVIWKPW